MRSRSTRPCSTPGGPLASRRAHHVDVVRNRARDRVGVVRRRCREAVAERRRREYRPVKRGSRRENRQVPDPCTVRNSSLKSFRGRSAWTICNGRDGRRRRSSPEHRAHHAERGAAVGAPHVGHGEDRAVIARGHPVEGVEHQAGRTVDHVPRTTLARE